MCRCRGLPMRRVTAPLAGAAHVTDPAETACFAWTSFYAWDGVFHASADPRRHCILHGFRSARPDGHYSTHPGIDILCIGRFQFQLKLRALLRYGGRHACTWAVFLLKKGVQDFVKIKSLYIYNSRHFPCSQKLKDRDKRWSWFDTICAHGLVVATGKCQDRGSY